jgi:tRNA A-37 threonylcarbamoyl transferase component Bud32/tetratricopeptide (TPR) repeat protein
MVSWLDRLRAALAPGIVVERELGAGGMGRVALGHDTVLDRRVAIKVLRPELVTAVSAERFLREARSAAGLRHPNVVQVHRAGEVDGLLFYIMDYLPGDTLATRLERGHLAPREVVRLGLDLLSALGAAHARKLIHRDVKPANIFLVGGRALLADFGIAYALDSMLTTLTGPNDLPATLAYISPEQLHGERVTTATDIYATGLVLFEAMTGSRWRPLAPVEDGDWSKVPGFLRGALRRALQLKPDDRWRSTTEFARALASAEHRSRRKRLLAGAAGLAALVAVLGWGWQHRPRQHEQDVVVAPFATAAPADSELGARLAGLTAWSVEMLTDLKVAPRVQVNRVWKGPGGAPGGRLGDLMRSVRSDFGAYARILSRGPQLEARLLVLGPGRVVVYQGAVLGDRSDPPGLADSVALTIAGAVLSHRRPSEPLAGVPLAARAEFLAGERAFGREEWLTAERHYLRALELHPRFVLAAWRVGNARRWLPLRAGPPYPPGLYRMFEEDPSTVGPVDRYLIEAQFRPSGSARFEQYDKALRVAARDPYPALLYGDELFHRGPLAGRPLREAADLLTRAVAIDSTLAPGWEHLAWARIRLGEQAEAAAALHHLERMAGRPEESEIPLPLFLHLAYELRFDRAPVAGAAGGLAAMPGALALAARGAMSFDLPEAQIALGEALSRGGERPAQRASGYVAQGIALFALGRTRAALGAFDAAARLFPEPREATMQAAEWRVVPAALGIPGIDAAERVQGRATLRAMVNDSILGARAAWALALDALSRGDSAEAERWRRLAAGDARLAPLLDGAMHARAERWRAALVASEPGLAYDSAGHVPDPFHRAALHLLRGEWLARLDRPADADRSWLWYENLDVIGWPSAEAQAGEVDWALGTWARSRRARAQGPERCALARRAAELWSRADPAYAGLAAEMGRVGRCPA